MHETVLPAQKRFKKKKKVFKNCAVIVDPQGTFTEVDMLPRQETALNDSKILFRF